MTNWAMFSALASTCGILATLISVAYLSGRMTQKLTDAEKRLDGHDDTLGDHEVRLGAHSLDIGRLHEWKNGFNAGSKSSNGSGGPSV